MHVKGQGKGNGGGCGHTQLRLGSAVDQSIKQATKQSIAPLPRTVKDMRMLAAPSWKSTMGSTSENSCGDAFRWRVEREGHGSRPSSLPASHTRANKQPAARTATGVPFSASRRIRVRVLWAMGCGPVERSELCIALLWLARPCMH